MAITFELMFNFNAKLEFNLLKKANKALNYGACVLVLGIIEYLIIQLTNLIM